jgi:hypothetical protein
MRGLPARTPRPSPRCRTVPDRGTRGCAAAPRFRNAAPLASPAPCRASTTDFHAESAPVSAESRTGSFANSALRWRNVTTFTTPSTVIRSSMSRSKSTFASIVAGRGNPRWQKPLMKRGAWNSSLSPTGPMCCSIASATRWVSDGEKPSPGNDCLASAAACRWCVQNRSDGSPCPSSFVASCSSAAASTSRPSAPSAFDSRADNFASRTMCRWFGPSRFTCWSITSTRRGSGDRGACAHERNRTTDHRITPRCRPPSASHRGPSAGSPAPSS